MTHKIEEIEQEILQINIGSTGIEIGNYCWQLYCLEHNLNVDGYLQNEIPSKSFFSQENFKYRPHTLFIDCDSSSIEKIKNKSNGIRKQIEKYEFFQGFIISHSTFGQYSNLFSKLLMNLKS